MFNPYQSKKNNKLYNILVLQQIFYNFHKTVVGISKVSKRPFDIPVTTLLFRAYKNFNFIKLYGFIEAALISNLVHSIETNFKSTVQC